jgi:hypothetical protein
MKYIFKIFLMLLAVTPLLTGCDLDVNEDPNRVTESTVSGDLIFPAAAHETGQRIASGNFTFLNNWIGYWSGSGTFAIDATETTYNITPNFGNALWQNHYNTLFDLEQARSKSLASGDSVLAAASMILSARLWQDLVDIYGNIPYSEAFKYTTNPQPAYDKGQDVYADLLKKLDLAISYMGGKQKSTFATLDIVNHGDKNKWIRFANTLKLRLLIRQSEVLGGAPTAEIAKIQANGGLLGAGETVAVNPGYTNATNKQSPFYANYGLTVNNAEAAPSVRANEYFVDLLEQYGDNREYGYFDSASTGGIVIPTVYGLTAGNPQTSSGIGPGLANNAAQDQWIFTSVESLFLQAEAVARGWMPGDAEATYKAAVTESFVFLKIQYKGKTKVTSTKPVAQDSIVAPQVQAKYYLDSLTDNSSIDNTAVTHYSTVAGGSTTDKVKFIAFQKYLAMCGIAPLEAWSDLRRIGFDIIPEGYLTANPGTISQTIPIRLLYPQNEYTTNATNANAQGTINQFTSKIFWDVN